MRRKILLGLTTTPGSDWREKTKEIDKFGIKELALFSTFLGMEERKELYGLLEKTKLEKIPHTHLRDDVEEWELDYYEKKWKSKLFNIHSNEKTEWLSRHPKYKNKIYIENTEDIDDFFIKSLDYCGGLCLDISHWEDEVRFDQFKGYKKLPELIKKYKIGCSHVSARGNNKMEYAHYITGKKYFYYSNHWLNNLSELDYVKKYVKYLPEYVSIELENPFSEQLKVKEYLEKIING